MRSPSTLPPTKLAALPAGSTLLADLSLIVVTPMFGGGVEPGHCDPGNLVRSSAIRGQLRFWWRACNAARFTSLAALHQAERALWGAAAKDDDPTHGPGAIGVRVTVTDAGVPYTLQEIPNRDPTRRPRLVWRREGDTHELDGGPGYALFPFTPQTNPPRGALAGRVDVRFRLQLTLAPHAGRQGRPDHAQCKEAAEQALWAWITFGGVGSRTRRGCGTLLCLGNADTVAADEINANALRPTGDIEAWLRTRCARHVASPAGHITSVPSLANCRIVLGTTRNEPIPAWKSAIEPLRLFLQGPGVGRNHGTGNKPGQSYWPEVGAARAILGFTARNDAAGHAYTVLPLADATGEQFPRADLGLPRLIKLASEPTAPVATVEANCKGFTRMASPIILKALPTSTTAAVPVALLLTAPHVWDAGAPGIRIKENLEHTLTPHALNDDAYPPRWPRTPPHNVVGVESARDAFMDYVASLKKDWHEWTPGEGDGHE